jgi:hypothetical protein
MSTQTISSPQTVTIEQEEKQKIGKLPDETAIGFGTAASFALLQRGAAMLAASGLMPKQFAGNLADCALVLNMAQRMDADPLMVAQNLYVVYGRPGWSSKFLIATFNKSGRYEPIDYEFRGAPGTDEYGCRAFSAVKATGKELQGPWITVGLAKKEGWYNRESKDGRPASKWPTMTELMLMYRSAAWFINTHAPEIAMGLRTVEEEIDIGPIMDEIIDKTEARLRQEREAVAAAVDAAPTKLDALVDADKAKGNGPDKTPPEPKPQPAPPKTEKKTGADAAMAQAKENLKQRAERESAKPKPAEKQPENPNYAVGTDPPPSIDSMFS